MLAVANKLNIRLTPITDDKLIREWAGKPENAEFFRRMPPVNMWPADTTGWWSGMFLVQRTDDEKNLGLLALTNNDVFHRSVEMGALLDKEACGELKRRDVAVEAITQALDYVFLYLGYEKIYSKTLAHRSSLFAGYEQYGFNKDGVLRSNVFFQGKHHDEVVYSLLKNEWVK